MIIIFYKIYCNDNTDFYIGSCKNFARRRFQHKKNTTNKRNKLYWTKIYKYIRDCNGWDNMSMIKLYEIDCIDKEYRNKIEQALIIKLNPTLNTIKASSTKDDLSDIINNILI